MTSHRFNQLVANSGRLGMTVGETKHLRDWLQQHFKGKSAYLFADELPPALLAGHQQQLPLATAAR
ncbi:hypothetical protein MUN86_12550 [Hymenobacter volaticus]|uniref:Uncharacterized protein n=2 Tax=Hymenobacter volaticus TaxID=2932254 RepID=A0ABY4G0Y0_9BACT|nr:hypothetical protein MUN86_12550 [Hymenobacter volaticus]